MRGMIEEKAVAKTQELRTFLKGLSIRTYHGVSKQKGFLLTMARNPSAMMGTSIVALMVLCAILAPWISPYDPLALDVAHRFEGPSSRHLLGTDELGRDTLSRIIDGARITVPIVFGVVALGAGTGVLLGILAGYSNGTIVGVLLLWIFDFISTFPGIVLVLSLVAVFGSSSLALVLVMALWFVPKYGRIARTETLSLRSAPYMKAAEGLGARPWQIIFAHIVPNIIPPVVIVAGMDLGTVVMVIAGLSYLGLGIQPPIPSWGGMLANGYTYVRMTPWLLIWACVALLIVMIGCSLFSSGLRKGLMPEETLSQ
jgi:peptide/nickel transport system permease protein